MDYKMLINEIQAHNKDLIEQVKEKNVELQRLREENKRYKEALEFYGNEINYQVFIQNGKSNIERDGGEKARQELKGDSK
ncbi:hypothetical protein BN997_01093 [Oceanobacillus oncorhynchi]|uniref:Uncharacterized protein n=2 Tax=Oceanobacillus oncorhynchi TaxID=545501 RepID=A0A0A1M7K4_9BACI|nr:hypothetical protein BN997_01093 [Oceanobacillus oncorhynchi]